MNAIARPWSVLTPDRPSRGIVRLSRENMSAQGIGAGAVLSLSGDRVTCARAFPAAVPGPVGLDAIVATIAAPRGRPTIDLKAAEPQNAWRVECQVLDGDAPARVSLAHVTVSAGDMLPLVRGRRVHEIACTPSGSATILPKTILAFRTCGGGPKEAGFAALAALHGADSSGVGDRVVAKLLTEIDGVEALRGVFLLGATNRLAAAGPALRQPGRFNAVNIVPPPDLAARRAIAALHVLGLGLSGQAFVRIAVATAGRDGVSAFPPCVAQSQETARRLATPTSTRLLPLWRRGRKGPESCIFWA